ncbi:MAG: stage III sporulation protein AD, partial [Bacillota bacterium]|nr:stage III sporulation protein AD [Bacillota bacterium]
MDILKIVSFSFMVLFVLLLFKEEREDIRILIGIAASCALLLLIFPQIKSLFTIIEELSVKAKIDFIYIKIVLKVIGITYLATFCSEICKDAGENSLASKVEITAKILILISAVPIMMAVLNS